MAFMKFYVGNEANASSHRDGIYIAIDTKKIFYNGDAYGGSEVDLSSYATKDDLNKYLPLTGGILTGNLYVNGRDTAGNFGISLGRSSIHVCTSLSTSSSDPYYRYESQLDNHSLIIASSTNNEMVLDKKGIRIRNKTNQDLLHAAGGTISIDELKSQLNIPDTSNLATKTELEGYLPLSGGKIYGDGLIISSKLHSREFPNLFMNIEDSSTWAGTIGGVDYLPNPDTQGLIVSVATTMAGSPDGKVYTCLRAGGIIFSSGMGRYSCYGENFVVIGNGLSQLDTDGCDGSINLTDTINFYSNDRDGYDPSKLSSISSNGFTIKGKTANDLLHAAGGTISIEELKSQLNIPDTSSLQSAIGTNTYTGANYVSKETNLTEAVLQLDEEIKATNDNLALEHTNAEATYAKKTELSNQIEVVQTSVDSTNTKIVNAKLSMASWTSGANATKLTFTGSSVGLGGTPAIFFAQGGITGGGNTIPTQSCIRFEGCHIYQDSNGFYVSLPKASDTSDGVMSGEDHKKLGGILNTTKNWVNEVRNDSIPTLPSSATVYKIMDLPGTVAECRASLYLICVPISSSSDKPRIYYNDETLCYLQPVVNGTYQYATGIMVLPDYSISGIYLGETYDYTDH